MVNTINNKLEKILEEMDETQDDRFMLKARKYSNKERYGNPKTEDKNSALDTDLNDVLLPTLITSKKNSTTKSKVKRHASVVFQDH